jgi:hypothetical protein
MRSKQAQESAGTEKAVLILEKQCYSSLNAKDMTHQKFAPL